MEIFSYIYVLIHDYRLKTVSRYLTILDIDPVYFDAIYDITHTNYMVSLHIVASLHVSQFLDNITPILIIFNLLI